MLSRSEPDSSGPDGRDDHTPEPGADGGARRLTGLRRVIPAVAGVATAVAAAFLPTTDPAPPTVDGAPVTTDHAYREAMERYVASHNEKLTVPEEGNRPHLSGQKLGHNPSF